MKTLIYSMALLVVSFGMVACATTPDQEPKPNVDNKASFLRTRLATPLPSIEELKNLIDNYYASYTGYCVVVSESPLVIKEQEEDTYSINCTEGGETQLDINLCSMASLGVEMEALQVLTERIMKSNPHQQQVFLQELWRTLQAIEATGEEAGKIAEGGSMQPLLVNEKIEELVIKKRKSLRKQWLPI